jgi:hypothetical protein
MKTVFRLLLPLIVLINSPGTVRAGDPGSLIFLPGEEFRYSVKWKFLRLGTITIGRIDDGSDDGTFRVSMLVESNPSIPFVDIREYNESLIDAATMKTIEYYGDFRNKNVRTESRYIYDAESNRIYHYERDMNNGRIIRADTIADGQPFVNGPSLLSYTRAFACSDTVHDVPTFVRGAMQNTRLDFSKGVETISIGAWPFDVRTRRYNGRADWEGGTSQGLSGKFSGWISDDFAAVPIRADMKVRLGTIRIELEMWSRYDWSPSTAGRLAAEPYSVNCK